MIYTRITSSNTTQRRTITNLVMSFTELETGDKQLELISILNAEIASVYPL